MPRASRKKRTSPKRVPAAASRRTAKDTPKIDMVVESGLWKRHAGARAMARRAIAEAAEALSTPGTELAIVLTDDSAIRLLNREWRGVDAATNVLSFPTNGGAAGSPLIGDIVLSYETIADEARTERKPFIHHVAHLAVHGYLHLLGYDHRRERDAEIMERKERDILRRLAVPDPYRQLPKA
jgi:probable rRNA maturation factor